MDRIKNIITLKPLEGYRTYILIAIVFIIGGLNSLGYIDQNVYDNILKVIAPLGIATFVAHKQEEEVVK